MDDITKIDSAEIAWRLCRLREANDSAALASGAVVIGNEFARRDAERAALWRAIDWMESRWVRDIPGDEAMRGVYCDVHKGVPLFEAISEAMAEDAVLNETPPLNAR
jgi:hypothetical protein